MVKIKKNGWEVRNRKDPATGQLRSMNILFQNGKEVKHVWTYTIGQHEFQSKTENPKSKDGFTKEQIFDALNSMELPSDVMYPQEESISEMQEMYDMKDLLEQLFTISENNFTDEEKLSIKNYIKQVNDYGENYISLPDYSNLTFPIAHNYYGKISNTRMTAIGNEADLNGSEMETFKLFMHLRFPDNTDGSYARDWATRIKYKTAIQNADQESIKWLKSSGYENL